jgi:hypothetical protein
VYINSREVWVLDEGKKSPQLRVLGLIGWFSRERQIFKAPTLQEIKEHILRYPRVEAVGTTFHKLPNGLPQHSAKAEYIDGSELETSEFYPTEMDALASILYDLEAESNQKFSGTSASLFFYLEHIEKPTK